MWSGATTAKRLCKVDISCVYILAGHWLLLLLQVAQIILIWVEVLLPRPILDEYLLPSVGVALLLLPERLNECYGVVLVVVHWGMMLKMIFSMQILAAAV